MNTTTRPRWLYLWDMTTITFVLGLLVAGAYCFTAVALRCLVDAPVLTRFALGLMLLLRGLRSIRGIPRAVVQILLSDTVVIVVVTGMLLYATYSIPGGFRLTLEILALTRLVNRPRMLAAAIAAMLAAR